MVDHDDLMDAVEKARCSHQMRDMGIHHDEHRIHARDVQKLLGRQEKVRIGFLVLEQVGELVNALVHITQDDVDRFFELAGHFGHAHGRAQAVEILVVMAHDEDLIRIADDFTDGMRYNARLYAGMFFYGLGLAAVELCLAVDLHGNLIAAAAKGQVKACLGCGSELIHALGAGYGNAHAERDRQPVRAVQGADFVEDIKFFRQCVIESLPGHDGHVEVVGYTAQEAAQMVQPLVEQVVGGEDQ